jgi:hypothetical protein
MPRRHFNHIEILTNWEKIIVDATEVALQLLKVYEPQGEGQVAIGVEAFVVREWERDIYLRLIWGCVWRVK